MEKSKLAEAFALAGVVALLDLQIERLNQARELLTAPLGNNGTAPKKTARRSTLSASGKKAIAEAQRKRWAAQKKKQRAKRKKKPATPATT